MRSKTQLLKTASTLKEFSSKIKNAQEEVLTPETVREISEEIKEVAEVAHELATEIAEGVPAERENGLGERGEREEMGGEEEEETRQIEVAAEETEEEKKKKLEAAEETDDDKDKLKEKVATLSGELSEIKREAKLAKLAPKYASLFPQSMHEAKLNEILNSKQPLNIVEAKVQEASDIITNKTMVKVASMSDSIYNLTDTSEEVNIASYL